MAPKRSSIKRTGPVSSDPPSTPSHRSARLSPGLGNAVLPHIPTKHSFAYGSSATPILPHMLAAKPQLNLVQMASTIEDAIQHAKERDRIEIADSPHRSQLKSLSMSPVRIPRREPTPDQMQLLDSLRDATVSPGLERRPNSNGSGQSTATPTPPLRHTFSATSSPGNPDLTMQQLYPPELDRPNSPVRGHIPLDASDQSGLLADGESVISWSVERDIHDDDLRRTRSKRASEDPHGKHITAPPRRFSGLAFVHETIEEEEEPASKIDDSRLASPSLASQSTPEPSSAPVKTIIPDRFFRQPSSREPSINKSQPIREKSLRDDIDTKNHDKALWSFIFRIAILVALTTTSMFTIYTFKDKLFQDNRLDFSLGAKPHIPLNETSLDALHSMSHQMVKLGAQVSSLSREVKVIKTEVKNLPAPTTIMQQYSPRQEKRKTNFLSIGLGVIIDPYMTSPTAGPTRTFFQSLYMQFSPSKRRGPQPPLAALTPWEDMGECWCSVPRQGMSQLSILLGRRIVPEEVVVEHMPKSATIRPEVAPKEMELWARFRYVPKDGPVRRSFLSRLFFSAPENISGQDSLAPDRKILHQPVMDTLHHAFPKDPESAYSDDELLGPHFYRIGRWTYDIHGPNYVQHHILDAVIDSPEIRVDKVVFRVKSNWGANDTCIYRLKLYGHM